mmetsp:Transcript_70597/g.111663  ORF Transcript_70597/g.111663 Transcript_70597/m.111663 type:complete len:210 (+) Transcript_70597:74-703(+)
MGSAASVPEEAKKMKEKELEELVAKLDKDTLKTVQAVVNKAVEGGASKAGAKEVKVHNVEDATNMKRAIFMWDYDVVYEALQEIELADKVPMGAEGSDLITDKGIFKDKDAESWEKMMGLCAGMFFQDQIAAEVPYMPPESAKAHALWLWSAAEVEKNFKDIEVKGKDGKEVMMNYSDQSEKASELIQSEGKKFMEAMGKFKNEKANEE